MRRPGATISIELQLTPADKTHPACASQLVFSGPHGPIALPDLQAIAERSRARDAQLAAATDPLERATRYVAAFDWRYRNPNKKTDTWESESYALAADGSYTITRYDLESPAPLITTGHWTVADHGKTLILGAWRLALRPCRGAQGYLCAIAHGDRGDTLFPTAAR